MKTPREHHQSVLRKGDFLPFFSLLLLALCMFPASVRGLSVENLGGNEVSAIPETSDVIVSNILYGFGARSSWVDLPDPSTNTEFVQTWQAPSDFDMEGFAIQSSNVQNAIRGCGGARVKATLYSYGDPHDHQPRKALMTDTGITAPDFGEAETYEYFNWILFRFSEPIALKKDGIYGVFIEWQDPDDNRSLSFHHSAYGNDVDPDGALWMSPDNGATWHGYASGVDAAFFVIGTR